MNIILEGQSNGFNVHGANVYNGNAQDPVKDQDLEALKCSSCNFILREPKQVIVCGHRYCKPCIEQMTSGSSGPYICRVDNEHFELEEVRNDRGCLRDILALEVDCPTQPPCSWRGKLTDLESHKDSCPNKKFPCPLNCGGYFQKEDLETHKTTDCPNRPCECHYCKQKFPQDSIQEHLSMCDERPVSCQYCQTNLSSQKHLTRHLEEECEKYTMPCLHKDCPYKGVKSGMLEHLYNAHFIHFLGKTLAMVEKMDRMEEKMEMVTSENRKLHNEVNGLQKTVSSLQSTVKELTETNASKDEEIKHLKVAVEDLQNESDEWVRRQTDQREGNDKVEKDGITSKPKLKVWSLDGDVDKDPALEGLEAAYSEKRETAHLKVKEGCVDSDVEKDHIGGRYLKSLDGEATSKEKVRRFHLCKPEVEMSRLKQEVDTQQTQITKVNENLQIMQNSLTRYAVAIDEVRLRQDVLDVKTTHGILVWKIPDIRRRYRDATERRTISLYSPPFYTSPHGYRMCIRTYLNGDGIGKGTHLSLFFVLMRSEHDNLLSWPFKQSVRFTLINQRNPELSITEAFVPDQKSPSFKKPENNMNIASGFPKFARQSVLQDEGYTLDNVIYIKCQVDLSGLSSQ